jgi:hypothetical protein
MSSFDRSESRRERTGSRRVEVPSPARDSEESPASHRGPAAVQRLQRAAGNRAVAQLLGGEQERSPVLDVVGRGGGAPLEPAIRSDMSQRFGLDFSGVRVHTDAAASDSAAAVQAQAYTVGNEIVFGRGAYSPGTPEGRHRIAHELTHVVQQSQGPVAGTDAGNGVAISDPSDRFEEAAEANATTVMREPPRWS